MKNSRAKNIIQEQKASREALQESSLMIYRRARALGDTHESAIKQIVNHCFYQPIIINRKRLAR